MLLWWYMWWCVFGCTDMFKVFLFSTLCLQLTMIKPETWQLHGISPLGYKDTHVGDCFAASRSASCQLWKMTKWITAQPHMFSSSVLIGREGDHVKMCFGSGDLETMFIWWALIAHPLSCGLTHMLFLFSSMWWALQNYLLSRFETDTLHTDLIWLSCGAASAYILAVM